MTDAFRSLHVPGSPLVLVNAWDAASARIVAAAGAPAVATTSAGVSWSLGTADGDHLDRAAALALVRRVAGAVSVPVTADIETGYGAAPADVAATVREVVAAGAAGVNIEDVDPATGGLRDTADQCARLTAARSADDTVFLNARIDTYLRGLGGVAETVERATAYLAAGADGVFVPGVTAPDVIAVLVERIAAPVNVMAGPGAPAVGELAKLGVARVSVGSAVAQAAYTVARRAATEAYATGTWTALDGALDFGTVDGLLS
ncbi:isocitrate lyase/PEP mutase family protein [Actinocatenispora rupis]|uniref:Carboxyvinyl-carboxyphosphonate phosphorylmutase n=1 Tax=Actinocatenispora rupis TaxID=519421 RepID=A0A8J3N8R7_9ACTN|nr:isocitrate lyase/phosphoenolpyruvate mutase family protein [Actinocatenispora rupis]GID10594.1 carboxyvinyl-carboxyphosphonate phosphorylmutase [Actinocatenispora rupis]